MAALSPRPVLRRRLAAAVVPLVWAWSLLAAGPVAAADPVAFGDPTATSAFGKAIEFHQPVTLVGVPRRVELLLATPGDIGPEVIPVPDAAASGTSTLDYRLDMSGGNTVPNTTFTARWRVVDADDRSWLGPAVTRTYADDRFAWTTLEGSVVHVHWYDGDQAFGQKALKIGDNAVAATAKLLGVTETDPIDFFIYADQQAFYDALGPATRENVGGQARPDIRTLFALIAPGEIDAGWVESVVPHELTHVVFATAVDNPYHDPPHWLNEGLAVYLSDGYQASDRSQVAGAAADGSIIPLDGLAGAFPTTRDRFFLAYAESVSAVDRIVRVNGREALVKLIRSYHDGVSDDEAFSAALGRDVAGFEADWLTEVGATAPTRRGPRPAPAGPLPEGWSGPRPNPSFEVIGSLPPVTPGAPRPTGDDNALARFLGSSLSVLGLAVVAVMVILGVRRLRRRVAPRAGADEGWNQIFGRRPAADNPHLHVEPGPPSWLIRPSERAGAATPGPDEPATTAEPDGAASTAEPVEPATTAEPAGPDGPGETR